MKLYFYEQSELTMKFRRNLLFVSSLGILHFVYVKLNTLKIFNVSIPEEAINYGLPLIIFWFAINYFYYMYAEYTQWKAKFLNHIQDIEIGKEEAAPMFLGGESLLKRESLGIKNWQHTTLIPEIRELSENNIKIKTCFATSLGMSSATNKPKGNDEIISKSTEEFKKTIQEFFVAIKSDIKRIESFQNAIQNYTLANKFRLYVFDIMIPILITSISLYFPISLLILK